VRHIEEDADLIVVGGGLSGVCCAITAAREGVRVVLVQDRPVLGGNASSEVRLWVLGATSHMGNNNRWAREGGVIDEILVENMWRNPEGNPVIFDSILLEMVVAEKRIDLRLNTAIHAVDLRAPDAISSASGYCSQNETFYTFRAPLFVDASGDGIVGFLAGAEFRMGAEAAAEFGEQLAPELENNELLGHSLYFYSRDVGFPVEYVAPQFALKDITAIPRFRELRTSDMGCRLWWLEYGGNLDTIHDTEAIKWELWRVAYGVWDHLKNSGEFPDAKNLALEWMGTIPGKRESRRFVGDTILTQQDVMEQRTHDDAVSFGGWAVDLHPADGVFSTKPGCVQWHAKGVYQIPFRAMYSRTLSNLFVTGRLLSATHIAFGSTRVMATCAHNGQAVGVAAAMCVERGLAPRDLSQQPAIHSLQQRLLKAGQHIPGLSAFDPGDEARTATIHASSTLRIGRIEASGETRAMDLDQALLIPAGPGRVPVVTFLVDASAASVIHAELWRSSRRGNTTPDVQLGWSQTTVEAGLRRQVVVEFAAVLEEETYVFLILRRAEACRIHVGNAIYPGILRLCQRVNQAVAKSSIQQAPASSGVDTFAFWLPERRPAARLLAASFEPPLEPYSAARVTNGLARPWEGTNAWCPDPADGRPALSLRWASPRLLSRIEIVFDTDFDHPMESVLMTHPERVMPCCVTDYRILADRQRELATVRGNHQTRQIVQLEQAVETSNITIELLGWGAGAPAIYEVRCY
jgi:hypothetical protein